MVAEVYEITAVDYGTREHRVLRHYTPGDQPTLAAVLFGLSDDSDQTVIGVAAHKNSTRPVGTCYYA